MRVIWAPRAITRAAEIAQYIAADRPGAADAWVEQLFAKAAALIYRLDPKRVVVLTMRNSRQEWDPADVVTADS